MASEAFSKGNEAFVEDNYEEAIQCYTEAINADSSKDDYFVKRAHAYTKLENYRDAVEDTERAINLNSKNSKAYFRKGIAEFHLDEFSNAKKSFEEGQKIDGAEKQFATWIRKCDAELSLLQQNKSSENKSTQVGFALGDPGEAHQPDRDKETTASSTSAAPSGDATATPMDTSEVPSAKPQEIPMPIGPKTRYDWYQTETHVIVTILVKNVKKEHFNIDIQEKQLSVTLKMPTGSDYSLELDLLHSIRPEESFAKILSSKVEIKLKKKDGLRWERLEGDGTESSSVKQIPGSPQKAAAASSHMAYPSSSHYTRDWDKLVAEIKQEEKDEKPEGDAALNSLFQKIYADGTDEVKKAMNKSFYESGGTVLSTNWKDIGAKQTDIKPPDGMEWKKWNS